MSVFDDLQDLLCDDQPDYALARQEAASVVSKLHGEDRARSAPIIRLIDALHGFSRQEAGVRDILVLLRQVIRTNHRIRVGCALWHSVEHQAAEHGLRAAKYMSDGNVEITADPWMPVWLMRTDRIDRIELRRKDPQVLGDGMIEAMTGKRTYLSAAQKAAVYASLFAPAGSTTLITLPTGSGKSLCSHLPAWLATHGGRRQGHTTIVVVPTVALAEDQRREAQRYFPDAIDDSSLPQSWTGATPSDLRESIKQGICSGTLPLLFTSPEALMGNQLGTICREAASGGTIDRLVIDEAHIVGSWGAGFRPEFQFLSGFRRDLLDASGGRLITLLLSATVTDEAEDLLRRLFGCPKFQIVRANRLRPEPAFWFSRADTKAQRQQRVLEALRYLPRPAILYVTRPEDAAEWLGLLREAGYCRLATYTGQTSAGERDRVLTEWKQDRRDLIVATSAFGLGVDKSDVRTVIHACLPEDLDRYYQEVGRGGRDGVSSISLMCTIPEDEDLAFNLRKSAVARVETIIGRWEGMYQSRRRHPELSNVYYVDTDAPPRYDPEMLVGDRNREWNSHTLLMLQRAGLLSVAEVPHDLQHLVQDASDDEVQHGWLEVTIHDPSTLNDSTQLAIAIKPWRHQERLQIDSARSQMIDLVNRYANSDVDCCISMELGQLYPLCHYACGGCAYCRGTETKPFCDDLTIDIEPSIRSLPRDAIPVSARLRKRLGGAQDFVLTFAASNQQFDDSNLLDLTYLILEEGIQQFIAPDTMVNKIVHQVSSPSVFAGAPRKSHIVVSVESVLESPDVWLYPLSSFVIYPPSDYQADSLFRTLRDHKRRMNDDQVIIHLIGRNLWLPSESGRFIDRINHPSEDAQQFVEWLKNQQAGELEF